MKTLYFIMFVLYFFLCIEEFIKTANIDSGSIGAMAAFIALYKIEKLNP